MAVHWEIVGTDREVSPATTARVIGEILPFVLRKYGVRSNENRIDAVTDWCGDVHQRTRPEDELGSDWLGPE